MGAGPGGAMAVVLGGVLTRVRRHVAVGGHMGEAEPTEADEEKPQEHARPPGR